MACQSILIVEDNIDDQLLLHEALKAAEVPNPLVFVKDGKEAEDYLLKASEKFASLPRLVFLDLTLPSLGGLRLLEELRANPSTRRLPIIILTGSHKERDLLDSYSAGANSYIIKGGHIEEFYDKINCLCNYWLKICRLPSS